VWSTAGAADTAWWGWPHDARPLGGGDVVRDRPRDVAIAPGESHCSVALRGSHRIELSGGMEIRRTSLASSKRRHSLARRAVSLTVAA